LQGVRRCPRDYDKFCPQDCSNAWLYSSRERRHLWDLLKQTTDEAKRQQILKLLAEEDAEAKDHAQPQQK
jgi:hypothetical protein